MIKRQIFLRKSLDVSPDFIWTTATVSLCAICLGNSNLICNLSNSVLIGIFNEADDSPSCNS